jgi:hypothetical protein
MKRILACFLAVAWVGAACTPSESEDAGLPDGYDYSPSDTDTGTCSAPDADGDTISDEDEGRAIGADTDGDTVPDYVDPDSDGDTIPDSIEAGDGNACTLPRDSDGDAMPDYRDLDSDGNGIFDSAEGTGDLDGDGIPDFADLDDDADGIGDSVEIAGNPSAPPDFDHDTVPDYRDNDSDNDTIHDRDEGTADTDGDTVPDRFDNDADNDTWPDSEEAGDDSIWSMPVDTDGDTVADYRDLDSDADGLLDSLERDAGTNRLDSDSDDDGINDMIEYAAGTNPLDPADNPRARGNFVFLVPYNDPTDMPDPPLEPDPLYDTLVFSTSLQFADVYFLVDTTGSMGGEISNLRTAIRGTLIPGILASIPDVWLGVGHFDDYPISPYGSSGDWSYANIQSITGDVPAAQAGADRLPLHNGADGPESHVPALYATASGDHTRCLPAIPARGCPAGTFGYPCFRTGAVPIIVLITDYSFHNGPGGANGYTATVGGITPPSYDQAIAALVGNNFKVIGVNSGIARPHLEQTARDTGAVDLAGTPLVYDIAGTGTGLGDQIINAVRTLANQVPIRVDALPIDDPTDSVDAVVSFILRVEANASGATIHDPATGTDRICTVTDPLPVDETADGHPDYFPRVLPGTSVCFDIHARRNETVPATREPQMFRANIQVQGDRITILDEREIFFLVPPVIEIIIGK